MWHFIGGNIKVVFVLNPHDCYIITHLPAHSREDDVNAVTCCSSLKSHRWMLRLLFSIVRNIIKCLNGLKTLGLFSGSVFQHWQSINQSINQSVSQDKVLGVLGHHSRLPCYVFCICLLTNENARKSTQRCAIKTVETVETMEIVETVQCTGCRLCRDCGDCRDW